MLKCANRINGENVKIRKWQQEDIGHLLNFIQKEGWDVSMYDIRVYMKIDPEYLYVATDYWNTALGFIGIVKTSLDLYFITTFVVREDLRGRGIGRKLWKNAMEIAGDKNISLDSASDMVGWYMKNGFNLQTILLTFYKLTLTKEMKKTTQLKLQINPLLEEHWPALMKYDRLVYPKFNREKILRSLFTDEAVVEVVVAIVDGVVYGCGSIHKQADNVYSMRNVFADDEDILDAILRHLFKKLPNGCIIRFGLPNGKSLPHLLKAAGEGYHDSIRLYTKAVTDTNTEKVWVGPVLIV